MSWPHRPDSERWPGMSLRKVPANSVLYGEFASRNGKTCWAAFHDGQLVAVASTHDEARAKYASWHRERERARVGAK
jgi:hypothetical protein